MVKKISKFFGLIIIIVSVLFFYSPFIISGKVPIPADTIIGLYHPYRDLYVYNFPNGIPFKNFLVTDPVRQTYVWKELAIDTFKKGEIPLWNPYEMSGKPLLGNFQTGAFYPLNLLFLIEPFYISWSIFIFLQSIIGGLFMYLYLRNLKLNQIPSALGSLVFVFSGFSVSWLEWGNILQTAIWLPLILLAIDKLFDLNKWKEVILVSAVLSFSYAASFLAGHLQIFFYLFLVSFCYFILNLIQFKDKLKKTFIYLLSLIVFLAVTFLQWYQTLRFIVNSARSIDQNFINIEGWFVPFRHLIQFIAPDFFGNPTTLNYWGTWNYGELTGYVGVTTLILALVSLFQKNPRIIFYFCVILLSLVFSLPTGIAFVPYNLNIPFLSSAQPTRLLFLVMFSLSVLASFGLSYLKEKKKLDKSLIIPVFFPVISITFLWISILSQNLGFFGSMENLQTAKRNLILPTIILGISILYILILPIIKSSKYRNLVLYLLVAVVILDLLRFAQKFTPFTDPLYIFPETKSLRYIKDNIGYYRVSVMDRRIMPPNFFTHYKIQTIEGYDPLYLKTYAEFISILERGKPDISTPYGFNRIITPHNFNSQLFDFLGVKYVLTFDDLKSDKMIKVFEEGSTKIYQNKQVFDRAFFVEKVLFSKNIANDLFTNDLRTTAVVPENIGTGQLSVGNVTIDEYSENKIKLITDNKGDGFLVLSDINYEFWEALIDGKKTKIYQTNHAFRGIVVPKGLHEVIFRVKII